ncbi:MAG: hypothetical protein AAF627_11565 [Myxococcota bacterium]
MHIAQPAQRPARQTTRILARSIYKDMKSYGIPQDKILEVASELIALVTKELDQEGPS